MTASKLTGGAVVGEERNIWRGRSTPRVWTCDVSGTLLERAAGAGESPVGDGVGSGVECLREYRRTRGIRREAGWTTTQG